MRKHPGDSMQTCCNLRVSGCVVVWHYWHDVLKYSLKNFPKWTQSTWRVKIYEASHDRSGLHASI